MFGKLPTSVAIEACLKASAPFDDLESITKSRDENCCLSCYIILYSV